MSSNETATPETPNEQTNEKSSDVASDSPPTAGVADDQAEPGKEAESEPIEHGHASFKAIVEKVASDFVAPPAAAPSTTPPMKGPAVEPPGAADVGSDVAKSAEPVKAGASGPDACVATPPPVAPAASTPNTPSVQISLAHQSSTKFAVVSVPIERLADFLNAVGAALAAASFVDVKIWVGRAHGTPAATLMAEPPGMIVDVTEPSADPLASIVTAGLPVPTVCWPTESGFKGLWVFDRPTFPETFTAMAEQFVVGLSGGNPALWLPTQGHHLPIVLKSAASGTALVSNLATQTSTDPLLIPLFSPTLPLRLERALSGERTLTDEDRKQVADHLASLGLVVPNMAGSHAAYDKCPVEVHGTTCCFVGINEDGSVAVSCIADHGRMGGKDWNERDLFTLATGTSLPAEGIDPVANVPGTWAGLEYFRSKLLGVFTGAHSETLLAAAARVWFRAKAGVAIEPHLTWAYGRNIPLKDAPPWHKYVEFYESKLAGDTAGPCQVFFDTVRNELRLIYGDSSKPLKIKGPTLSSKANYHEYDGSLAVDAEATLELSEATKQWKIVVRSKTLFTAQSLWNKALSGNASHLAVLGLPRMGLHELPVAFVEPSITLDRKTKCIEVVRTARTRTGDASFDSRAFFTKIYLEGRLPLASEADVLRLLMAIASPLLRDVAPGLLGIYWFIGPSGAGKDYLAGIVEEIWRRCVVNPVKAAFDLHITDELEVKRAFATASPAVFARAKEAGKSIEMVNTLIKLAGTDQVTARGLWRDELQLANTFTFIADSVEDLPERKEISRRTVMIGVGQIGDEISKGQVRDEILEHAADIIANLKALVESHPAEWYLQQANTGSRPVVPVALAGLFGATLPQVSGGGTEELFENMAAYIKTFAAEEGKAQQTSAREKDGKEQQLFPSYRLSHFVDQMSQEVGSRNFFKAYGSRRGIEMLLHREADYHTVESGKRPYLPVTLNGTRFAFKLVKGKRNFVLVEEMKFCAALGITPISVPPQQGEETEGQGQRRAEGEGPSVAPVAETPTPKNQGEPMRFSRADLADEPDEVANASNGK